LLGVVRAQIGRDAIPSLPMISRAEEKLGAHVDGTFLVWRQGNWCVPIPSQFFLVVWLGLNVAGLVCAAIDPGDKSTLRFGVEIIRIRGIGEHPETVATVHVL